MLEKLKIVADHYDEINEKLMDPNIVGDQNQYRDLMKEFKSLTPIVDKYKELKPDLVLMDITMPEMDGIAALKAIKANDPGASVIMCSAMGQQAMVIESIQSGAKDFIVKPFQADRVIEAVKKVVG